MVSRKLGLLAALPEPPVLPDWLTHYDLAEYARAFAQSGLTGGLNFYRNLDRNRELLAAYVGVPVATPALYLAGERDPGRLIPGMQDIVDAMRDWVPLLEKTVIVPAAGHWLQQEKPTEVTVELLRFLEKHANQSNR